MKIDKTKIQPVTTQKIQPEPPKEPLKPDKSTDEKGDKTGILSAKKEIIYADSTEKPAEKTKKGKPQADIDHTQTGILTSKKKVIYADKQEKSVKDSKADPKKSKFPEKPGKETEIKKKDQKEKDVTLQSQTSQTGRTPRQTTPSRGPDTTVADPPVGGRRGPDVTEASDGPREPRAGSGEGTRGPETTVTDPPVGGRRGPDVAGPTGGPIEPRVGSGEEIRGPDRTGSSGESAETGRVGQTEGAQDSAGIERSRNERVAEALEDMRPSAYERGGSYREMNADYHAGRWFHASNHGAMSQTNERLGNAIQGASDQECRQLAQDYMERNSQRYSHYTPEQRTQAQEGLSQFLMQRRQGNQPAPGQIDNAAYDRIRQNVERRRDNIYIDRQEANNAHTELMNMNPRDANATMQRMQRDGMLGNYMNNINSSQRQDMVQHLERGGVLRHSAQGNVNMVEDNTSYPRELRSAIYETNRSRNEQQINTYEQQSARWRQDVNRARTIPELRDVGPPPERPSPVEMRSNDPAVRQQWQDQVNSRMQRRTGNTENTNLTTLDRRIGVAGGRSIPGIYVDGGYQVTRSSGVVGRTTESHGQQVRVDQSGNVTRRRSTGEGSQIFTPAGSVSRETQVHHDTVGIGQGAVSSTSRTQATSIDTPLGEARHTGNIQENDQERRAERDSTQRVSTGSGLPDVGGITGAAEVDSGDRRGGRISLEPSVTIPNLRSGNERTEYRGNIGVGFRGARTEDSTGSPSGDTFYTIPRELRGNTPWDEITPERREDLTENLAWTREEYENRRARMHTRAE